MEEQFVTYDIALKLKLLGFDEECLACFNRSTKFQHIFDFEDNTFTAKNSKLNLNKAICVVPLWQQVEDWLEKQQIYIYYIDDLTYGYKQDYGDVSYKVLDKTNNTTFTGTYTHKKLAQWGAIFKALSILRLRNKIK